MQSTVPEYGNVWGRQTKEPHSGEQDVELPKLNSAEMRLINRLLAGGLIAIAGFGFLWYDCYTEETSQCPKVPKIYDNVDPSNLDFMHQVLPLKCHSYNDDSDDHLIGALYFGCSSIQANVMFRGGDALIGRESNSLHSDNNLKRLYVDPLMKHLESRKSETFDSNASYEGVFPRKPQQTLILMLDFKNGYDDQPPKAAATIQAHLEPLRRRNLLTYFNGTNVIERPITIVVTGNAPIPLMDVSGDRNHRDIFFDAPLTEVINNPGPPSWWDRSPADVSKHERYHVSQFNYTNSYLASTSLRDISILSEIFGPSRTVVEKVRAQVKATHDKGLQVRYRHTPEWPFTGVRNKIWRVLKEEGVDYINTSDPRDFYAGPWKRARYNDLKTWSQQFYAKSQTDEDPSAPGPDLPPATADDKLCKLLWGWLLKRDDLYTQELDASETDALKKTKIRQSKGWRYFKGGNTAIPRDIGAGKTARGSHSGSITAENGASHQPTPSTAERRVRFVDNDDEPKTPATQEPVAATGNQPDQQALPTKTVETYLFAHEDRMWRSICGHEIDYQRVHPSQLHLLTIIAAYGEHGILQPDLVQISGQDKRSVPHRTDVLDEHGYIKKIKVVGNGQRTSRLFLWKYVKRSARDRSVYQQSQDNKQVVHEGIVDLERFLEFCLPFVKQRKDFTWREIHDECALPVLKSKAFARKLLRNLEEIGCIEKTRPRYEKDGTRPQRWKFVRDLTSKEKFMFCKLGKAALEHQLAMRDGDDAHKSDDRPSRDAENVEDAQIGSSNTQKTLMPVPWTPRRPTANQLFDVIDRSGVNGISAVEIRTLLNTQFYKKPIESLMSRLSDVWQFSQPPHLRHFSIVKDTAQTGKVTHFQYRSFENFQSAAEIGKTTWGIFESLSTDQISELKRQVQVNSFDFEPLPANLFVNGTGTASLKECLEAVKVPLNYRIQSLEYILKHSKGVGTGFKRGTGRPKGSQNSSKPQSKGSQKMPKPRPARQDRPPRPPKPPRPPPARRGRKPLHEKQQALVHYGAPSMGDEHVRKTGKPFTETKIWKDWIGRCRKTAMRTAITEFGDSTPAESLPQVASNKDKHQSEPRSADSKRSKVVTPRIKPVKLTNFVDKKPSAPDVPGDSGTSKIVKLKLDPSKFAGLIAQFDPQPGAASNSTGNERVQDPPPKDTSITGGKRAAVDEPEDQRPSKVSKLDSQSASEFTGAFDDRVQKLQTELSDLSRPAVYLNPPQRLNIKKGRPRHQLLMVMKSERLRSFDWFKPIAGAQELYLPTRDLKGRIPGVIYEYEKHKLQGPKRKKGRPRKTSVEVVGESDKEEAPDTPTQEYDQTPEQGDDQTVAETSGRRSSARGRNTKINYAALAEGEGFDFDSDSESEAHEETSQMSDVEASAAPSSRRGRRRKVSTEAVADEIEEPTERQGAMDSGVATPKNLPRKRTGKTSTQPITGVAPGKRKRGLPKKNVGKEPSPPQPSTPVENASPNNDVVDEEQPESSASKNQRELLNTEETGAAESVVDPASQPVEDDSGMDGAEQTVQEETHTPTAHEDNPTLSLSPNASEQPRETEKPTDASDQLREDEVSQAPVDHDAMDVDNAPSASREISNLEEAVDSSHDSSQRLGSGAEIEDVDMQELNLDGAVDPSHDSPHRHRSAAEDEDIDMQESTQDATMSGVENIDTTPSAKAPVVNGTETANAGDERDNTRDSGDQAANDPSVVSPPGEEAHSFILDTQQPNDEQEESKAVNNDASEAAQPGTILYHQVHPQEQEEVTPKKTHKQRMAISRSGGSIAQQRYRTILDLLEQANGAYPAGRELSIAFAHVYVKSGSQTSPDHQTVARAVKSLINNGKIRKVTFVFAGYGGVTYSKSIIHLPHLSFDSEVARCLREKMIKSGAELYFPPEVEVPEKHRQPKPLVQRKEPTSIPRTSRAKKRHDKSSGAKRLVPAWKGWARKTGAMRIESPNDSESEIDPEQEAMQNSFQLRNYSFNPDDALIGAKRPRRGRKVTFTKGSNQHQHVSERASQQASKQARKDKPLLSAPMRVKQARKKQLGQVRSKQTNPVVINPRAWMLDPAEAKQAASKHKDAQYTTLTDPGQSFYASSGTFSTEFALIRKPIPQLRILPDAYRNFEEQMPRDLSDIIRENEKQRQKQSQSQTRSEHVANNRHDAVDEIELWEKRNKELLTSNKSLMQAVFINCLAEDDVFKDVSQAVREGATTVEPRESNEVRWAEHGDEAPRPPRKNARRDKVPLKNKVASKPNEPTPAPTPASTRVLHPRVAKTNRPNWSIDPAEWPEEEIVDVGAVPGRRRNAGSKRDGKNEAMYNAAQLAGSGPNFTKKRKLRLICVVVAVRTLTGHNSQTIDWDRVFKVFNVDISKEKVEEKWPEILVEYQYMIDSLQSSFEKDFLEAYQANKLPPIDFNNLDGYDWEKIISWMNRTYIEVPTKSVEAPPPTDRKSLDHYNTIEEEDGVNDIKWKMDLFDPSPAGTYTKRLAHTGETSFSIPAKRKVTLPDIDRDAQAFALAENYVRANGFMPDKGYDAERAAKRLKTCGVTILPRAFEKLRHDGVFKYKKGTKAKGLRQFDRDEQRNYTVHNNHMRAFKRNNFPGGPDVMRDAVSRKCELDADFEEGTTAMSETNANDSTIGEHVLERNNSNSTTNGDCETSQKSERTLKRTAPSSDFTAANAAKKPRHFQPTPATNPKNNPNKPTTHPKIDRTNKNPPVGPRVPITRDITDGQALLLLNEYAHRRLKIRTRIPRITSEAPSKALDRDLGEDGLSMWGLMRGHNTRFLDKFNCLFPVEVAPTRSYKKGVGVGRDTTLPPPPQDHESVVKAVGERNMPVYPGKQKPIPFWQGITNDQLFLPENWRKLVGAVLSKVATQIGITADGILSQMGPAAGLQVWEVRAVLGWLEKVGAVRRVGDFVEGVVHGGGSGGGGGGSDGHDKDKTKGVDATADEEVGYVAKDGWWNVLGGFSDADDDDHENESDDDHAVNRQQERTVECRIIQ
ncbi:MAG: hypothetical protein M1831_004776 [Alyxoria varia]|nr:MAG: hypothetical protein M1831_004776 [Alyxoria varia]